MVKWNRTSILTASLLISPVCLLQVMWLILTWRMKGNDGTKETEQTNASAHVTDGGSWKRNTNSPFIAHTQKNTLPKSNFKIKKQSFRIKFFLAFWTHPNLLLCHFNWKWGRITRLPHSDFPESAFPQKKGKDGFPRVFISSWAPVRSSCLWQIMVPLTPPSACMRGFRGSQSCLEHLKWKWKEAS